jgi:ferric-dicitrate binding protein FerR (iron transport regulator)
VIPALLLTLNASGLTQVPEPSRQPFRPWRRSWAVYSAMALVAVVVPVLAWVLLGLPR